MNTMTAALTTTSRRPSPSKTTLSFRRPNFDCRDLTVTARKKHFVRPIWTALHLEAVQKDYRLNLRLGHGFSYPEIRAEIHEGILTLTIPKRNAGVLGARRAA